MTKPRANPRAKPKRARGQRSSKVNADPADLAKNYNELATALGVTRQQIHNWRRNPRLKKIPKPDGMTRHSISAWKKFMADNGLGKKSEEIPERILLENEERRLRIERLRIRAEKESGTLVPKDIVATQYRDNLSRIFTAIRRAMENEIPPALPLPPNEQMEAKRKISATLDKVLREAKERKL